MITTLSSNSVANSSLFSRRPYTGHCVQRTQNPQVVPTARSRPVGVAERGRLRKLPSQLSGYCGEELPAPSLPPQPPSFSRTRPPRCLTEPVVGAAFAGASLQWRPPSLAGSSPHLLPNSASRRGCPCRGMGPTAGAQPEKNARVSWGKRS